LKGPILSSHNSDVRNTQSLRISGFDSPQRELKKPENSGYLSVDKTSDFGSRIIAKKPHAGGFRNKK
jgi:hypothetical protein